MERKTYGRRLLKDQFRMKINIFLRFCRLNLYPAIMNSSRRSDDASFRKNYYQMKSSSGLISFLVTINCQRALNFIIKSRTKAIKSHSSTISHTSHNLNRENFVTFHQKESNGKKRRSENQEKGGYARNLICEGKKIQKKLTCKKLFHSQSSMWRQLLFMEHLILLLMQLFGINCPKYQRS